MDKTFGNVKKTYNLKSKNGITIVALIITIVVMLILTSITIGAINGNLLDYTGKGKIKTEITDLNSSLMKKILISENKKISGKINDILNIESPYNDKLEIEEGELVYIASKWTEEEIEMLEEMGIGMSIYDTYRQNTNIFYIVNSSTKIAKFEDFTNFGTIENFRDMVNAGTFTYDEAKLIEDIKLNEGKYTITNGEIEFSEDATQWTPIGDSSNVNKYFKKIFDGQNHTISGIYINNEDLTYAGLFGVSSGTIKNINVVNGEISAKNTLGGIVGSNQGEVENCNNSMNIYGTGGNIGGICGGGNTGSIIKNCNNTGNIQGTSYIGGIGGNCSSTIEKCSNSGNISGTSYTAGIVGRNLATLRIEYCYNTGTITGSGIAGQSLADIYRCYNTGNIKSASGGICGTASCSVIECYNTGKLENGASWSGGIVGYGGGTGKEISNCFNFSDTTGNTVGICGYCANGLSIKNCYNVGTTVARAICRNKGGIMSDCYYATGGGADINAIEKSKDFMKSQAFVTLLNTVTTTNQETGETSTTTQDVWVMDTKNINNGFPILKWQK